jgi:C4-dicarboxylate transporter DctM subunit
MGIEVIVPILLATMLLMLSLGVPVAFSVGTASLVGYWMAQGARGLEMVSSAPWLVGFNYTILAIPVFILMGHFLEKSGITESFFRAIHAWVGRVPGSLGVAALLTGGVLAGCSGSGAATQATLGSIAWPHLKKWGYSNKLATGLLIGGGSLGPLIPPSGALILYGALTDQSVARLFMAALIPGVVTMFVMISYIVVRVKLNPSLAPSPEPVGWDVRLRSLGHFAPFSIVILVVLGSIYFGWATPTEAASVGVALAFVLMVLYGRCTLGAIIEGTRQAVLTAGFIILIVVFALSMSSAMVFFGLPQLLHEYFRQSGLGSAGLFTLLVALYLVLGCFIDGNSMQVLTVPLLTPLLKAAGIDLVWFGVALVILIEIGTMTPPFGMHIFIVQGVTGRPAQEIVQGVAPYWILWLAVIVLMWFFPWLVLWFPSTMM